MTSASSGIEARIRAFPIRCASAEEGVITWREAGQGVPVVLLHGISSGSASWLLQLEAMSGDHRILAWDAPGYGASTALSMVEPNADDYARILAMLLACVPGSVHLVGHSLGALVAAAYARRFPERLLSLSLLNPALGYGRQSAAVRAAKLLARLEQIRRLGPAGLARERAPELVSTQASPLAVELLRWNAQHLSVQSYEQAARMLAGADLISDLTGQRTPLLVLTGSEDHITPEETVAAVVAACPKARFVSLPGVGHATYIESPERVNPVLGPFIEAQEPRGVELTR